MAKFKRLLNAAVMVTMIAGAVTFTGCGPSAEELKQLDDLKSEVKSLEKEVNSLKSEKAKIEREIAERQAKLDECAKTKATTKDNLSKIGK